MANLEIDPEFDQVAPGELTDRRRTARIPTGARLLHRAVGMRDYEVCELALASTSAVELLLPRPLATGTVLTILIRPEGTSGRPYRLVGRVDRRGPRGARWLHVVKAPAARPWSPMYIYDVMCQVLNGYAKRAVAELMDVSTSDGGTLTRPPAVLSGFLQSVTRRNLAEFHQARFDNDDSRLTQADTAFQGLSPSVSFDQLNVLLRKIILSEATVVRRPAGTKFVQCGAQDDICFYLVEGTLELEAFDGDKNYIEAGMLAAQFPISTLRPHVYTVTAATDVAVFILSQKWFRKIVQIAGLYHNRWGIEVTEEQFLPPTDSGA